MEPFGSFTPAGLQQSGQYTHFDRSAGGMSGQPMGNLPLRDALDPRQTERQELDVSSTMQTARSESPDLGTRG